MVSQGKRKLVDPKSSGTTARTVPRLETNGKDGILVRPPIGTNGGDGIVERPPMGTIDGDRAVERPPLGANGDD